MITAPTVEQTATRDGILARLREMRTTRSVLALCVARGDKSCIEALGQIGSAIALQEISLELLEFMLADARGVGEVGDGG